jgi:hypothetical protein
MPDTTSANMAKQLSQSNIDLIIGLLDGWSTNLTWETLIDAIESRLHVRYSRQALDRHDRIKLAYTLRKEKLRNSPVKDSDVKSVELRAALDRLQRLENENERLKAENNALLEQFALWAYNARTKGLDKNALNRPLPFVDRGRNELD